MAFRFNFATGDSDDDSMPSDLPVPAPQDLPAEVRAPARYHTLQQLVWPLQFPYSIPLVHSNPYFPLA